MNHRKKRMENFEGEGDINFSRARVFLAVLASLLLAQTGFASAQIVVLGHSAAHGYVAANEMWSSVLESLLRARGSQVHVINAGVNGETTKQELARVDSAVPEGTRLVILTINGFNDNHKDIVGSARRAGEHRRDQAQDHGPRHPDHRRDEPLHLGLEAAGNGAGRPPAPERGRQQEARHTTGANGQVAPKASTCANRLERADVRCFLDEIAHTHQTDTPCQIRSPKARKPHVPCCSSRSPSAGLTLKNRLVVPPMVHYRAGPGNVCGTFHTVHLGRYALGGFGLIFVEATGVEEIGLINEYDLGMWSEAQAKSFRPLIDFVKGEGGGVSASSSPMADARPPRNARWKAWVR